MNSTLVTPTRPARQSLMRRIGTAALWLLQLVLALQFAAGGLLKLGGSPEMVAMFTTIGVGQWLRVLVGVLEIAGALGLLIPRLSGLAALGLAGLLMGATATNLLLLGADPWFPLVLLVLSVLVAVARRRQLPALLRSMARRRTLRV